MILIVGNNPNLARIWARHLQRHGQDVTTVTSQDCAFDELRDSRFAVVVLDLLLKNGSAMAVADFANYRQPEARIVFVTKDSFFADGSLFTHIPNMAAILQEQTPPTDLAEIVAYHGRANYA